MDLEFDRFEEQYTPQDNVDAVKRFVGQLKMPLLSTPDKARLLTQLHSKVQRCSRKELVSCLEKKGAIRLGVCLHRIHNGECVFCLKVTTFTFFAFHKI